MSTATVGAEWDSLEHRLGEDKHCNLGVLSTPHVMYVLHPRDASCLRLVSSWIRKRNILASAAFIIFYIIPRGGKATCPFTLVARVSHLNPVDCILSPPGNELQSCLLLSPPPSSSLPAARAEFFVLGNHSWIYTWISSASFVFLLFIAQFFSCVL